jgi:hypothetical protein
VLHNGRMLLRLRASDISPGQSLEIKIKEAMLNA